METKILNEELRTIKNSNLYDFSLEYEEDEDPILCNHCLRTASNGIRCLGMCVADDDY